jgi:alcohol dehydrogenase
MTSLEHHDKMVINYGGDLMKCFYRILQRSLFLISKLLPWREPVIISGENSLPLLKEKMKQLSYHHYLIVTDQGIVKAGLLKHLLIQLNDPEFTYTIYDQTIPNPTIQNVEDAALLYRQNHCEAIIGFGGGSAIDAAKCVGIRIVKPKTPFRKMKGILKVNIDIPYLIAIPTTAGTGSETTIAAVISDPISHEKFAISDLHLMPKLAVLDPLLIENLPPFYTATTGMDALTHAVEAYIGKSGTKKTNQKALNAIKLIHDNLVHSYSNPHDLLARLNMLYASYDAGYAFTRAYVGNIHAIAHTFGGFHQIPHGYANAIIMPHILKHYGSSVYRSLSQLSDFLKLTDQEKTRNEKAIAFIEWIESLNQTFSLPSVIEISHDQYLSDMASNAFHEANPLYPVPVILSKEDFKLIIEQVSSIKE